jgi:hypothetical protein
MRSGPLPLARSDMNEGYHLGIFIPPKVGNFTPPLTLSDNARRNVMETFESGKVAGQYVDLYKEVLRKSERSPKVKKRILSVQ